ncbi:N-terminal nucleophile aminohydrolase, partial [Aureobasidium melanogenum]
MVACRFRNHKEEQPPSLYFSTRAGTTLNRKYPDHPDGCNRPNEGPRKDEQEHGKHVIVASEPSTYIEEDWNIINKNQYLIVHKDGRFTLQNMLYSESWNADDAEAYKAIAAEAEDQKTISAEMEGLKADITGTEGQKTNVAGSEGH